MAQTPPGPPKHPLTGARERTAHDRSLRITTDTITVPIEVINVLVHDVHGALYMGRCTYAGPLPLPPAVSQVVVTEKELVASSCTQMMLSRSVPVARSATPMSRLTPPTRIQPR